MNNKRRVDELLHQGSLELAQGNRRKAHSLWRQAANIDPKDKRIWVALLEVIEGDEDRRVCLQNIVSLDPEDEKAIRKLKALGGQLPPNVPHKDPWYYNLVPVIAILIIIVLILLSSGRIG